MTLKERNTLPIKDANEPRNPAQKLLHSAIYNIFVQCGMLCKPHSVYYFLYELNAATEKLLTYLYSYRHYWSIEGSPDRSNNDINIQKINHKSIPVELCPT